MSLPVGAAKRGSWKAALARRKEDRTWWMIKLDLKNHPDIYQWLAATAGSNNTSVAKVCKAIIQDAMNYDLGGKDEIKPRIQK